MESIIHDITCSCICNGTDKKQSETLSVPLPHHLDLTPDFSQERVTEFGRTALIVEFATSRANNVRALETTYNSKYIKYASNLMEINTYLEKKRGIESLENTVEMKICHLVCCVVTSNYVVTNAKISQTLVNELCNLNALGNSLRYQFESLGLIKRVISDQSLSVSRVDDCIKMINDTPHKFSGNLLISDENIKRFESSEIDEKNALEGLRSIFEDTKETLDKHIAKQVDIETRADGTVIFKTDKREERIAAFNQKRDELKLIYDSRPTRTTAKAVIPIPYMKLLPNRQGDMRSLVTYYKKRLSESYLTSDSQSIAYRELFLNCLDGLLSKQNHVFFRSKEDRLREIREKGGISTESAKQTKRDAVTFKPSYESTLIFAKEGVEAKHLSHMDFMKTHRYEKGKSFHIFNTPTGDIENWIQSDLKKSADQMIDYRLNDDLIRAALETVKGPKLNVFEEASLKRQRTVFQYEMMQFCETATSVAMEAVANLIKNVDSNQWLVGSLPNTNVMYIIKPTNKKGHIFISLLFEDENLIKDPNSCGVFKDALEIGEGLFCCQFFSLQNGRAQNWVTAKYRIASLFEYFCAENMDADAGEYKPTPKQSKELKLCFLINFDDKRCTEDVLISSRYVYQRSHETLPRVPDASDFITSLPSFMNSRLGCHIAMKLIDLIRKINEGQLMQSRVYTASDGRTIMEFYNLHDYLTGEKLSDYGDLLNIFYIGYLKNKNQDHENNTKFSMIRKLLEEDKKVDYDRVDEMAKDGNVCPHDFNIDLVKLCGHALAALLSKHMGKDFMERLGNEIKEKLASITSLKVLSTTKATSGFTKDNEKDGKFHPNGKVFMEGRWVYMNNMLNPLLIEAAVRDFCSGNYDKFMHISLFEKKQHGGMREISIMAIIDRIWQRILEVISETICGHIPQEITNNPNNESTIFRDHTKNVMKERNVDKFTIIGNSNDAKRWNQMHLVAKFGIILTKVLPKEFHKMIWIILERFENKKLRLPEEVFNFMNTHMNTPLYDDIYTELRAAFHGEKSPFNRTIKPRENFILVRTGMLQGLLQSTSSLYHCAVIEAFQNFHSNMVEAKAMDVYLRDPELFDTLTRTSQEYLLGMKEKAKISKAGAFIFFSGLLSLFVRNHNQTFLGTHSESAAWVVTSDDSAIYVLYQSNTGKETKAPILFNTMAQARLAKFYLLCGIMISIKSTTGTENQIEFKSEFNCIDQSYQARFKNVSAAFNQNVNADFVSKQQNNFSMIRSIYETGVSSLVCFTILCHLARMHYLTLGSENNDLFPFLKEALLKTRMPATGLHLISPSLITGIATYSSLDYAVIKNMNRTHFFRESYTSAVEKMKEERKEDIDKGVLRPIDIEWALMRSMKPCNQSNLININFSNMNKALDMIYKLGVTKDDLLYFNKHPQAFFEIAMSEEAIKAMVAKLVCNPNMADAMGKETDVARELSKAVYILSSYCISLRDSTARGLDIDRIMAQVKLQKKTDKNAIDKKGKISLIALVESVARYLESAQLEREEEIRSSADKELEILKREKQDLNIIFPAVEDFEFLFRMEMKYSEKILLRQINIPKRKKAKIRISETKEIDFTLLHKVLIAKWFDINNVYHKSVIDIMMKAGRKHFPWIRDTFQESLDASLFPNAIDLLLYLETIPEQSSYIRFKSNPFTPNIGENPLETAIRKLFWPGFEFINSENMTVSPAIERRDFTLSDFRGSIAGIGLCPIIQKKKDELMEHAEKKLKDQFTGNPAILAVSPRRGNINSLKIIYHALFDEKYVNSKRFTRDMETNKNGTYGIFTQMQEFDPVNRAYFGFGIWQGYVSGTETKITMYANKKRENNPNLDTQTYLTSVVVGRIGTSMTFFLTGLENLCKDLKIINDLNSPHRHLRLTYPNLSNISNFKQNTQGCPVYQDLSFVLKPAVFGSELKTRVERIFRNGLITIRLKCIEKLHGNRERDFTILSYTTSLTDFHGLRRNFMELKESRLQDWFERKPAPVDKIISFLKLLKSGKGKEKVNFWLVNELQNYLRDFASYSVKGSRIAYLTTNFESKGTAIMNIPASTEPSSEETSIKEETKPEEMELKAPEITEESKKTGEEEEKKVVSFNDEEDVETEDEETEDEAEVDNDDDYDYTEDLEAFDMFENFIVSITDDVAKLKEEDDNMMNMVMEFFDNEDLEEMFSKVELTRLDTHPILDNLLDIFKYNRDYEQNLKIFINGEAIPKFYLEHIEALTVIFPKIENLPIIVKPEINEEDME
uniref:RNA-directed RNA polymerase L n=1 Tax=Qingnian mosquito virus TaxID=1608059 RepID=A0A0B5KXV2_9VIRU|nr:RNA-dependent RNA polymerase [Qingnian Mosquito Virus]